VSVGLPPIPELGDDDLPHDPGGPRLTTLLVEEHRRVEQLCEQLDAAADPDRRRQIADVLVAVVSRHLSAEEQYLYPAIRAALPDGGALADQGIATDRPLRDVLSSSDVAAAGTPARVAAAWRHHRTVVEQQLLPGLRTAATDEELVRLGNRAETAEEAAPTRPHPDAPLRPPWNRVVDPALGVLDKTRDLLSGRTTYPEDLTATPVDRDG